MAQKKSINFVRVKILTSATKIYIHFKIEMQYFEQVLLGAEESTPLVPTEFNFPSTLMPNLPMLKMLGCATHSAEVLLVAYLGKSLKSLAWLQQKELQTTR